MSYYPGRRGGAQHVTAFVLFFIGIGLTIGLYYVKTRAQSAKIEVARMERLVAAEKIALNVLKAEIAHLESPARVATFAESELGLSPTTTNRVLRVDELKERFPLVKNVQVKSLAVHSAKSSEQAGLQEGGAP